MRATLANLESEEQGIVDDFHAGAEHGMSMRQHLNNIRKFSLWRACDAKNFEHYVKLKRLPVEPNTAFVIARQGEVANAIQDFLPVVKFSGKALSALGTIRHENVDGTKSHEIDIKKVKRVSKKAIEIAADKQVTPKIVKDAYAACYEEVPAKPLGEQLQNKIGAVNRFARAIEQLPEGSLLDANVEYPGVVERLAKAYSGVASLLRKGLK